MTDGLRLVTALVVGAGAAFALTPVAIRAAARFDFYDQPVGYKGHAKATPYLGGAAVLAGFLVALVLLAGDAGRTAPIAGGAAVLWVVGTTDDRRTVSPALRVIIELALATILWATDLGWDLGAGWALDLAVTCGWVVSVVNAINLFDNMDGASSTVAFVVSAAVAALGVIEADAWLTAAGAAMAGSCLGFLPYNLARPSARIFLGDGGSMPVGFVVAALVMTGVSDAVAAWQALVLGLMLVGIPALDTALVIISRRRKGISVLTGGRDHLTHRTHRRFGTAHSVALTLGTFQALVATVALVAIDGSSATIAVIVLAFLATAGSIITFLEREEDRLHHAGELRVPDDALRKAQARRERRNGVNPVGDAVLAIFAVGAGISPLFFGYYASSVWVPVGLGLVVLAAAGTIRRPPVLTRRGWVALGALTGLGVASVLSAAWAQSAEQATIAGNRWLVLAAVLGLALVLLRSPRREAVAVGALAAGILVVAGVVLVRMLGSNGSDVFLAGRLNDPLGYINAEATVFLMGVWLCFAAVERRVPLLAGPALACATWLAGLALLSQSRGAAIAAFASIVVVLAVAPGRTRRLFALLTLGAGLLLAHGPMLDIFSVAQASPGFSPTNGVVHSAASRLLVFGALAGVIWGLGTYFHDRVADSETRSWVDATGRVVIVAGTILALVVGLALSGRISHRLNTQWHAFTHIETLAHDSGSRLVSGTGNRYEYWRVAWGAFKDHPGNGLGAGNFDEAWFADRHIAEDVQQPHSIELQLLSELGLIGGVLLAAFLAAFGFAVARVRRAGEASRGTAVAAIGVVTAWLVHTSVDWQHLIPGVTAIALVALGVLLRHSPDAGDRAPRSIRGGPAGVVVAVAIGGLVMLSGALLTRQGLADHYRSRAFDTIASDPRHAIKEADRSLRLDGDAVRSYYAKAAALARLDRGEDAAAVLLEATRREAHNPVTWALLGDLATRRGLRRNALRYYQQALRLNPRDPGLRQTVARAKAALSG